MAKPKHLFLTNKDGEKACLGAMLRSSSALLEGLSELRTNDFYDYAHQRIFEGMLELNQKGRAVDQITLADWIDSHGLIADIGGHSYIAELWEAAPVLGNAKEYIAAVKENSLLRSLDNASEQIAALVRDPSITPTQAFEQASEVLFRAGSRKSIDGSLIDTRRFIDDTLEEVDRRKQQRIGSGPRNSVDTGWPELDRITGGLQRRELTILAARPSVGKTVAALNIALHALSLGERVFFASLEQSHVELGQRSFAKLGKIDSFALRTGNLDDADKARMFAAIEAMQPGRLVIDPSTDQTSAQIAMTVRRLSATERVGLAIVDYLQLLIPMNPREQRYRQIAEDCARLRRLARECDVPVLCLAQLGRQQSNRADKRPQLSDLRESGDIEQTADCVLGMYRPLEEEQGRGQPVEELKIAILKQRNGPLGEVTLKHYKRFFDLQSNLPDVPEELPT